MTTRRRASALELSVKRTIADVEKRTPGAGKSWAAELALTLVKEIEAKSEDTLSARVSAAKLLRETLTDLQATAPAVEKRDGLDELTARRQKRRAS